MSALIASLPIQLACQLIYAGNHSADDFTLGLDTSAPKQTPVIPDGYTHFPDIGVAYKYYNASLVTWYSARKACIAHGGNLAVIDSFKKINYIHSLEGNPHNTGIFVGIHRLFGNGEWVSVITGLPVATVPWAPVTLEENQERNCLASWNDIRGTSAVPCSQMKHFICEISLD